MMGKLESRLWGACVALVGAGIAVVTILEKMP